MKHSGISSHNKSSSRGNLDQRTIDNFLKEFIIENIIGVYIVLKTCIEFEKNEYNFYQKNHMTLI